MVDLKTEKVIRLQNAILNTVANLVEYRDLLTGSHIGRTERYFEILVLAVMNDEKYKKISGGWDVSLLRQSSLLHDVGKIAIRDDILLKPGRLDEREFSEMKKHVFYGLEIIEKMAKFYDEDNFMEYARIVVEYHHEKWDGSGYLKGLSGTEIPLLGRVMSIADVYDAITSERPYKKAMPHEKAMEIILNGRGSHFDPSLVDIFEENADAFKNANMLENT
jgi:putative two-component system response regulator